MTGPFDPLPQAVEVNGARVAVDPDFRLFAALETAALEKDREAEGEALLRFYRGRLPEDLEAAVEALVWFYRCGRAEDAETGAPGGGRRCYDFQQDADALYASFYQAYHIDLHRDALHWWAFRKLMLGLPEGTPFARVVRIRTADTSSMDKEEKRLYSRLKRQFALRAAERSMTLEERDAWMRGYVDRRFREWQHGT